MLTLITLLLAGMGVYFYVGKLAVAEYLSVVPIHNFAVSQVKMLLTSSKASGVVFSLIGVVAIAFAQELGFKVIKELPS